MHNLVHGDAELSFKHERMVFCKMLKQWKCSVGPWRSPGPADTEIVGPGTLWRSFCGARRSSVPGPGGPLSSSLCVGPGALCVGPGASVEGPRWSLCRSLRSLCPIHSLVPHRMSGLARPQLRPSSDRMPPIWCRAPSAPVPLIRFRGPPRIRLCGNPAPIRVPLYPVTRDQAPIRVPPIRPRAPSSDPRCHPSNLVRSLFPGENPKPYCLGDNIE